MFISEVEVNMVSFLSKRFWLEVLIKNVLLVILSISLYPIVKEAFSVVTDKAVLNNLVLFVGLIIVVPLFANFAFTYETIKIGSKIQTFTGHLIAFFIMLGSFLLLEMIDVLFVMAVGNITIFRVVLFLFALVILLYDFWDANRIFIKTED